MELGSIRVVEDNVGLFAAAQHRGIRPGQVETRLGVRTNDDDLRASALAPFGVDPEMSSDPARHLPHEEVDQAEEDQPQECEDDVGHQPCPMSRRIASDDLETVGAVGEGHHRPGSELYGIVPYACAVESGAVDRTQVSQPHRTVSAHDLGVPPSDLVVRDDHVAVTPPSEHESIVGETEGWDARQTSPGMARALPDFEFTLDGSRRKV